MMISCDQCDQWFYADDIGIQLLDDQEDKPFICEQ